MRIVISDTSPIRALANLGLLTLLQVLYDEIVIPKAVADELRDAPAGHSVISPDDLAAFPYLKVHGVTRRSELARFLAELDRGESEALALAIELKADLILMDELAGRAVARREGLEVIGVLGVLLEAKRRGFVESVSPLLNQLQERYQFFIGDTLRREILRAAGEWNTRPT